MKDFLTFEFFITPYILIFFYYFGVLFIPALLVVYRKKVFSLIQKDIQWQFYVGFIALFLFLQLVWRMMFEMMIGYFDMHNYLQTLVQNARL